MAVEFELEGIEELMQELQRQASKKDVKTVVQVNGRRLENSMKQIAKPGVAFVKGYSVGNLARQISRQTRDGGLSVEVGTTAEYGEYLELGTRKMSPEPFARPALDDVTPQFIGDLKQLGNKK